MNALNHFAMSHLGDALFWITLITAAMYIVAVIMLVYVREELEAQDIPGKFPMTLAWFAHATFYWSVISFARLFLGYTGPSAGFSIWGAFLYMQAPATVIIAVYPIVLKKWKTRKANVV